MNDMNAAKPAPVILCVEDEIDLRSDIAEELVAAGYEVLQAADGKEATGLLPKRRPDLILCDITMPRMGGYAFLEHVRQHHPELADVPFVFLTALADREAVIDGKNSGADDYLVKPIDYEHLLATIRSRLSQVERMRKGRNAELARERRAVVEQALADAGQALKGIASTLDKLAAGVILLERDGTIRHANETAREILAEADGIALGPQGLRGASAAVSQGLKRALDEIFGGNANSQVLTVAREFRRPLLVQVSALGGSEDLAAALFIIDPERPLALSADIAAEMYGLTPSESRVAIALAKGQRLDEIGESFGIAPTTISFHLQNIFRKTQTGRQADLVALLVRSALALEVD